MYQDFFQLQTLPFSLTPNPSFFCQLKGHQEALDILQFSIKSGESLIKIIGEVGSGKTLLCQKLLESLDEEYVTAYIPNSNLTPVEIRKAFAREIGLDPTLWHDQHELLTAIYQHLVSLHAAGKKIIMLVDESHTLSNDSIETIQLLTNLDTNGTKLLQVVLFGQPELDKRLNQPPLRQLKECISSSYHLPLMNREDLDTYIHHRLALAGHTHGDLFTKKACNALYRYSRGIPRFVNILSHKALQVAYVRGDYQIDHKAVRLAVKDTDIRKFTKKSLLAITAIGIVIFMAAVALMLF